MDRDRLNSRIPRLSLEGMFPYWIYDNPDKANELQALFDSYKRDEIPRHTFLPLLKEILGDDQLILSAATQMHKNRKLQATVNEQPRTQINSMTPLVPCDRMFPFLLSEIHKDKANEIQALFDKYKKRNLPVTVNEQMPVVAYDQMFPFLFSDIDQDKAGELKDLFDKYKRNEIPRNTFYSLMKDIVGEELLLSASEKMQQVDEQCRTQISFRLPLVPYDLMFPFLFPEIHKDKANEIQALFDKYKRDEIPKYDFVSLMKGIAGAEKLRSAEATMIQQKISLQVPVNDQPRTQINSSERVLPFDQLFRFLIPVIEPDKAIRLQTLFEQYKRAEIAEHTFVPIMKGILGDQMLRSATAKVKQQQGTLMVPVTQIYFGELVLPFDQLFPFLISHIDPDKAIDLEVFFDKYKRREIDYHTFEPVMKGILGEQMLRLATEKVKQQRINLLVPVNEQPRTQINSSELVLPFDQLFRFLISRIDPDKAIELQTLFDKYNRGEIAKHTFVPFMKVILGDQMLRSATAKVKQQKINLPVPVKTQVNSSEPVLPFDQLFPFLISRIDPDKAIEMEGFFDKYKRGELAKHTFESVMKCILGDQMLRLATAKMKQQKMSNTGSSATSL